MVLTSGERGARQNVGCDVAAAVDQHQGALRAKAAKVEEVEAGDADAEARVLLSELPRRRRHHRPDLQDRVHRPLALHRRLASEQRVGRRPGCRGRRRPSPSAPDVCSGDRNRRSPITSPACVTSRASRPSWALAVIRSPSLMMPSDIRSRTLVGPMLRCTIDCPCR